MEIDRSSGIQDRSFGIRDRSWNRFDRRRDYDYDYIDTSDPNHKLKGSEFDPKNLRPVEEEREPEEDSNKPAVPSKMINISLEKIAHFGKPSQIRTVEPGSETSRLFANLSFQPKQGETEPSPTYLRGVQFLLLTQFFELSYI